jgi:hypothetical protein
MMSLNQARIVTAIFAGLVLFVEASIPSQNAQADPSLMTVNIPKPITSITERANFPKLSNKNTTPQLHDAVHHLKAARIKLQNDPHLDRDNRVEAIKATDKAIAAIEATLKSNSNRSISKSSKSGNPSS